MNRKALLMVLKTNLVFLVAFVIAALFLPLSNAERVFLVISMAVLAGFNWALLDNMKK